MIGRSKILVRTGVMVAVLALSVACTPDIRVEGYHLDRDRIASIQPGVTTQQQVGDILGSASSVATCRENADTRYYIARQIGRVTELDSEVVGQQVVAVDFDDLGRVEKIREYGLKDARDVDIASRTTPTQGEELGFFEQLLGNGLLGQGQ